MAKDINIGGRLHSIATGNVVAGADEILDDNLGKKQTQINAETYSLVESVNNALDALNPDQQEALAVAAKANANEAKLGYYVCDTGADIAAKTIAATGYALTTGGNIRIKMTNANTADAVTLNINNTGAKALFYNGEQASSTNSWEAGEVVEVYYDGTQFIACNSQGGGNTHDIDSSDDITVITDEITKFTQLKFANKNYSIENYSGLGKIHLKKNIETVNKNSWVITSDTINKGAYVDLSNSIGGIVGSVTSRFSMGYYKIPVVAGETYKITGYKADKITNVSDWTTRFWALSDNNNNILDCYKSNNTNFNSKLIKETDIITVEQNGFLWVNFVTYPSESYIIEKLYKEEFVINANILNVNSFNNANTIYIIQYDYDLNGMLLKMPINSVLLFIGGSIHNGTIIGNNTTIVTIDNSNIFGNSSILGTWKNINWYPEWFGAVGDGIVDDTLPLQKVLYLYDDIHSLVNCIMYRHTYKVTTGLYFTNNTSIKGGTLVAEFENPLDWVLQTKTLYKGVQMKYMNYCDWGSHDAGYVNHTNGGTIEDLTIEGVLNKHMVIPEGGDETSEKEWDGTYCPIYGGLKIQASRTINTKNVVINNVGTAIGRAACLKTKDESGEFNGCFTGFNGYAINGHVITTSYINANCHYKSSGQSDTRPVIPYHPEYAVSTADTSFKGAFKGTYIVGTGGIDDTDDSKRMPALCCLKLLYVASMIIDNVLIDRTCDVAIAGYYASITVRNAWFEGVRNCIAYGILSRMSFSVPYVNSAAVFDFIGYTVNFTLDCQERISGIGGEDDPLNEAIPTVKNKYCLGGQSQINILNSKPTNFPDDDRFTFTRTGKDLQVVAMTKAQFDAIAKRDEWTLYLIISDEANPVITSVYSKGKRIMPPKPTTITFEDANVLNVLSTKGYVTPDENNKVSLDTVESITDIVTTFRSNTDIESFYEFAYFSGITILKSFTFGGCTGLKIVALPRKLEAITSTMLENGGTKTVVFIPKTLKRTVNFLKGSTCTNLVLFAIVPPTLSYNGERRITNLYVPDKSVSAYQNNENWTAWCTNIKALSEFNVDNPSLVDVKNKVLDIYDL